MADLVFQHDRSVGVEVFTLEAERLVITGNAFGPLREKVFRLTNLSPECEVTYRRLFGLFWVPLICGIGVAIAAWQIATRLSDPLNDLAFIAVGAVPGCIYLAIQGFKPVEVTRFRDKNGNVVFELIETRKTRFKYADFVSELKKRIDQRAWH